MFIGRKNELQFLEECYHSNKAELVVLYGRRRVGKTELINVFCKDKPHFYYACREYTDIQQLQSFTDKIHSYHIPSLDLVGRFEDWEKAFLSVLQLPTDQKKILVIDEFPHICKSNPSVPSILQILWDEKLRHENVMIILSGSAMSFIEKDILSEKNPLYSDIQSVTFALHRRYQILPELFRRGQIDRILHSRRHPLLSHAIRPRQVRQAKRVATDTSQRLYAL